MGKAPEARDDVAVPAGEVGESREAGLGPCGGALFQRLEKRNGAFLLLDVFRMLEGQVHEDCLQRMHGSVEAALDCGFGARGCELVEGERARVLPIQIARKLVENDQTRSRGCGCIHPRIEVAGCSLLRQMAEAAQDLRIEVRVVGEPALRLFGARRVVLQRVAEPEPEDFISEMQR